MTKHAKTHGGENHPRRNTVSISLSDRELAAIDEYCALFGGKSRSAVIREGAVRFVRSKLIDRQTCLFPDIQQEQQQAEEPKPQRQLPYQPSLFDIFDEPCNQSQDE